MLSRLYFKINNKPHNEKNISIDSIKINLDCVNNVFSERKNSIFKLRVKRKKYLNYHTEGEMQQEQHTNVDIQVLTSLDMQLE